MAGEIRYVCPEHSNEVLFVESFDPNKIGLMVPDRPEKCPRCNIWYYKSQCKPVGGTENG